jgi:branched-subunit amino acid transport protein
VSAVDTTLTIMGMALATYLLRAWGLFLPTRGLRGFTQAWLERIPIGVFAALVAIGLPGVDAVDGVWRFAAAAAAALAVTRGWPLTLAMAIGLGVYLAARAVAG